MNILNFFTNQTGTSQRTPKGSTKHPRNLGMRRARFEQLEDRTLLSAGPYPDWYSNVWDWELESFLVPELCELYLAYEAAPENYTFDNSRLQVVDDAVAIAFVANVSSMETAPPIEQLEMLGMTNITTQAWDRIPCHTCRGWIPIENLFDLCMAIDVDRVSPMSPSKPADATPPNEADDPTKSYPGGTNQLKKDHPHFMCYEISSELLELYFDYMESPEDYTFDDSKLCVVDDSVAVSFASSYTETCPAPQIEQLEILGMTDIATHKMQNVPCRVYRGWIPIERILDLYRDFTVDFIGQISPARLADAAPPSEVDEPIEADPIEKNIPEEKTPEIVDNQPDRNVPDKPNPPDRITHPDPVKIINPVYGPGFPGWPIYCSPGFPDIPCVTIGWWPEIPEELPGEHIADTINTDQIKPNDSLGLALQAEWCSVGMLEAGETIRETYNAQSGRVTIADNANAGNRTANVAETIAAPSQPRSYDTIDVIAETNAYAGLIGVASRSYDFATGLTKIADGFGLVDAYLSGEQDDEFGSYSFVLDLSYLDG